MIWGDLRHWEQEKGAYHPALQRAVQYLLDTDLERAEVGTYSIEGDAMYAMVQRPKAVTRSERKSEHHRTYIDLQYLIEGEEELLVAARQSAGNVAVENRLLDRDFALYDKVEGESEFVLKPGMFAVFFPNDLHRPACCREGTAELKKVVIKIDKALLGL